MACLCDSVLHIGHSTKLLVLGFHQRRVSKMAKGGILVDLAMVSVWAASFMAIRGITQPFWATVQSFIGGAGNGNGSGGIQGGMS